MESLEASRRITERLTALSSGPAPRVRAWDGSEWGPPSAPVTIVLRHPGALRSLLLPPGDLAAGEAYVFDDVDVEGDIFALLEFAIGLEHATRSLAALRILRLARSLPEKPHTDRPPSASGRLHSVDRDRQAVTYHYDTGNDFFATFLDPAMVYSCAAFLSPDDSLEAAQQRKLDLVCRKLALRPGMRFLDVGCGWGALAIHAAAAYGVEATGITVSAEQAAYAREAASRAGVADRVRVQVADYRELDGEFDAVASVGMFEHVGRRRLPEYFRILRGLLAPGGQLLNHGIVALDPVPRRPKPSFVRTYVFPDGDIRPLDEGIGTAVRAGFELRDLEALRSSYALTLRAWVANLEHHREAAVKAAGERVYRIWRAYMAGSALAFERGGIGVYQMLLADPSRPWTFGRSHLLAADDVLTGGSPA